MKNNGDVLHELLTTHSQQPMTVPNMALLDWIATIPDHAAFGYAMAAYVEREPDAKAFLEQAERSEVAGTEAAHTAWLEAEFDPPMYSTSDETGERRRMSRKFIEECGMLSNQPHLVYEMPDGMDLLEWMKQENHDAYAKWVDWEGNEYERLEDGSFVRRAKLPDLPKTQV